MYFVFLIVFLLKQSKHEIYNLFEFISIKISFQTKLFKLNEIRSLTPFKYVYKEMFQNINQHFIFYFSELELTGCGFPGAPAHSSVDFSQDPIATGTVARYTCDRGFELLGPARRICSNNGTWLPQGIPFCGESWMNNRLKLKGSVSLIIF